MRVLHIQYRMPPSGNACFRLHCAMLRNGVDSSVLNIENSVQRNNVHTLTMGPIWFAKKCVKILYRKVVERQMVADGTLYDQLPLLGASIKNNPLVKNADVIYFHWIASSCLSFKEIRKIAMTGKPIVFFMHDCWGATGGCHYSFDCMEYRDGCRKCPILLTNISSKNAEIKRKLYSQFDNIIFISPSEWLRNYLSDSSTISGRKVFTVENVIDEKIFKFRDKKLSRQILDLPLDKTIISFGCQGGTSNMIKGWTFLQNALELLDYDNLAVVIYGNDCQKDIVDKVKYPLFFLGPIFDELKLSLICNASDLFVSPSLSESYGMTLKENILCGTPVVAFDNTAIGEIVKTGITGYLAKNKDSEDLAKGIKYIIDNRFKIDSSGFDISSASIIDKHLEILHNEFNIND